MAHVSVKYKHDRKLAPPPKSNQNKIWQSLNSIAHKTRYSQIEYYLLSE